MNKIEILNDYPWFHSKAFTVAPEIIILLDPATTDQRFTNYRSLDFRGHTNFISKSAFKNIKDVLGQEILNKSLVITAAPPIHRDDKKTAKKTTEHLKEFYEELRLIVNTVKPKLVISFGNSSARQAFNKSVKITTMRGTIKPSVEFNAPVFTTYNPNIIVANPAQARVFEADLRFVKNFVENGFVLRRELEKKYYWCTDLQFMVDNPAKEIAVDTETTGLHWYKDEVTILTLQICPKPGLVYCVPINHPKIILKPETKQKLKDQLEKILSHKFTDVIGHNYKFDWLQIKSALGFDSRYDHDTQNMAHLIDENMPKNIDDCIKVFVPEMAGYNDTLNKDPEHHGKTRMDLLGLDKMLAYACLSKNSLVQLADGSWEKIDKLVKAKYSGYVKSYDCKTNKIIDSKVIGWIRQDCKQKDWFKLKLRDSGSSKHATNILSPNLTPDHKVLTQFGYVRVDEIDINKHRIMSTEVKLTKIQEELIIASCLGDGGLTRRNINGRYAFRFSQHGERIPYVDWKANILENFIGSSCIKKAQGTRTAGKRYTTKHLSQLSDYADLFKNHYKGTRLQPSKEILEKLDLFGLAIWYCDDGTFTKGNDCRIYCEVQDKYIEEAVTWFKTKLGLNEGISYKRAKTRGSGFYFSKKATKVLHSKIHQYVQTSVEYKLLEEFRGMPKTDFDFTKDKTEQYFSKIEAVERYIPKKSHRGFGVRYCLTIEETHNFVTTVGVVKNCGDSDATMRLYHVLKKKIAEDKKLQNCYNRIVMPTLRAFCNVEQTGMFIDEEKLAEFEEELSEQQKERQERLIAQIPEDIIEKFKDTGVGIKLNRADLLIDYLFVHEEGLKLKPQVFTAAGKPSVSTKDHLSYFKKVPFVAELMTYIKEDKMLNTYLKGFWKYLKDGRIHPNYNFLTKTGRSSSREPNGQNFPKRGDSAKKFRECFVAPDGYVILEIDYSQIELRIVAAVSGDPAMIKIYKDGGDIHALTGAMVIGGVSLEEFFNLSKERRSELRYQAKSYNFGLIYGMSANGFKDYAETEYGILISTEDAIKSRKKFFNTYSSLVPWHNAVGDFVKKHGYVRSYTGRKRNLPEIFSQDEKYSSQAKRMAINSPIQGFGSELGCMTASRMADPYNEVMHHNEDVLLAGFVHDAIVAYVKKDKVLEGCRKVKKFMEDNPLKEWFGVELPVPIIAEAAIGANLANLVEIDSAILLDSKITTDEQLYETILKWSNNDDKINRNLGLIQQI